MKKIILFMSILLVSCKLLAYAQVGWTGTQYALILNEGPAEAPNGNVVSCLLNNGNISSNKCKQILSFKNDLHLTNLDPQEITVNQLMVYITATDSPSDEGAIAEVIYCPLQADGAVTPTNCRIFDPNTLPQSILGNDTVASMTQTVANDKMFAIIKLSKQLDTPIAVQIPLDKGIPQANKASANSLGNKINPHIYGMLLMQNKVLFAVSDFLDPIYNQPIYGISIDNMQAKIISTNDDLSKMPNSRYATMSVENNWILVTNPGGQATATTQYPSSQSVVACKVNQNYPYSIDFRSCGATGSSSPAGNCQSSTPNNPQFCGPIGIAANNLYPKKIYVASWGLNDDDKNYSISDCVFDSSTVKLTNCQQPLDRNSKLLYYPTAIIVWSPNF